MLIDNSIYLSFTVPYHTILLPKGKRKNHILHIFKNLVNQAPDKTGPAIERILKIWYVQRECIWKG